MKLNIDKINKKFKKTLSYVLIAILLLGNTIQTTSIFNTVNAKELDNKDLVSILVDKDIYSGIIKSKIDRYANDIQDFMPNSQSIIFPIEKNTKAGEIALLNEKLFKKGYNDKGGKLVGTILIGDIILPTLIDNKKEFTSLYPYTDFNNKNFIYDEEKDGFFIQDRIRDVPTPEIWHGVIRPDFSDGSINQDKLIKYFDKLHEYYISRENKTDFRDYIINSEDNLEHSVFYYDGIREKASVISDNWDAYMKYMDNMEDIAYRRFTREWLLKELPDIKDVMSTFDIKAKEKDFEGDLTKSNNSFYSTIVDIQTSSAFGFVFKNFLEVFNSKYISDVQRYIHNSGRYDTKDNRVLVDTLPGLIYKKDLHTMFSLKNTNDEFEKIVLKSLEETHEEEQEIIIPIEYGGDINTIGVYLNYFFGDKGYRITQAYETSISRGGGIEKDNALNQNFNKNSEEKIVEANRGYNLENTIDDINVCKKEKDDAFWGRNTPMNTEEISVDKAPYADGVILENIRRYEKFVKPIFDIEGSRSYAKLNDYDINESGESVWIRKNRKRAGGEILGVDLFEKTNRANLTGSKYDLFFLKNIGEILSTDLRIVNPVNAYIQDFIRNKFENGHIIPFKCDDELKVLKNRVPSYELIISGRYRPVCTDITVYMYDEDTKKKTLVKHYQPDSGACSEVIYEKFTYKKINSVITHDNPTNSTYLSLKENGLTPDMPVDKDHYVDYIHHEPGQILKKYYERYDYPNLFDIKLDKTKLEDREYVKNEIIKYLYKKQQEFRYNSEANFIEYLNITKGIELSEGKENNKLIEDIISAVIWHNISLNKDIQTKYNFIFSHYLDRKSEYPYDKRSYEIAYIGNYGSEDKLNITINKKNKTIPSVVEEVIRNTTDTDLAIKKYVDLNIPVIKGEEHFEFGVDNGVDIEKWEDSIEKWLKFNYEFPSSFVKVGDLRGKLDINKVLNISEASDLRDLKGLNNANPDGYLDNINKIKNITPIIHTSETVLNALEKGYIELEIPDYKLTEQIFVRLEVESIINPDGIDILQDGIDKLNKLDKKLYKKYIDIITNDLPIDNGIAYIPFSFSKEGYSIKFKAVVFAKSIDSPDEKILHKVNIPELKSISDKFETNINLGINKFRIGNNLTSLINSGLEFNLNKINKSRDKLDIQNFKVKIKYKGKVVFEGNGTGDKYIFNKINILDKIGEYEFSFKDDSGLISKTNIIVNPGYLDNIDIKLPTDYLVSGTSIPIIIDLKDELGNLAIGENYRINLSSDSDKIIFKESNSSALNKDIISGSFITDISSVSLGENIIKAEVTYDKINSLDKSKTEEIKVTKNIKINVIQEPVVEIEFSDLDDLANNELIAKGTAKTFKVKILDKEGNVFTDFNTQGSVILPNISYGELDKKYFKIINGVSEDIEIKPGVVANDFKLEFSIPGINNLNIINSKVIIKPSLPFRVVKSDIIRVKDKEDETKDYIELSLLLVDEFNNLIKDNQELEASIFIPEEFKDKFTGSDKIKFIDGIAKLKVYPKGDYINDSYLIVNTNIIDRNINLSDGTVAHSQAKVAFKIEEEHYLDKEKIDKFKVGYNSLYTVLVGSDYGNINYPSNLANELLFDTDSHSIAITTISDMQLSREFIVKFTAEGGYNFSEDTEVIIDGGDISFLTKDSRGNAVADSKFIFKDTDLEICENIELCDITNNGIDLVKNTNLDDLKFKKISDNLVILYKNNKIFSINKDGNIIKKSGININLSLKKKDNALVLEISNKEVLFGYLILKLDTYSKIEENNKIYVKLLNSDYRFSEINNNGIKEFIINSEENDTRFRGSFLQPIGVEDYTETSGDGMGWEINNLYLLNLTSGNSLGESIKHYTGYTTINLGDPLFSLYSKTNNYNLDNEYNQTLGTEILESDPNNKIISYNIVDYNNDGKKDVIAFLKDHKVALSLNLGHRFSTNKKYILNTVDVNPKLITAADLHNDGFADIIGVDLKGNLAIFENNNLKFERTNEGKEILKEYLKDKISGKVIQIKSEYMDEDEYSDIIIFTDLGNVYVLYGGVSQYKFNSVKLAGENLDLKLESVNTQYGSSISWDNLKAPNNQDTDSDYKKALEDINYRNEKINNAKDLRNSENLEVILKGVFHKYKGYNKDSGEVIISDFLNSYFGEAYGIKISHNYEGININNKDGDKIKVSITIKNSGELKTNFKLLDIKPIFTDIDLESKVYLIDNAGNKKEIKLIQTAGGYDFEFNDLGDINTNDILKIEYGLVWKNRIKFNDLNKLDIKLIDGKYSIVVSFNERAGGLVKVLKNTGSRTFSLANKIFTDNSKLAGIYEKINGNYKILKEIGKRKETNDFIKENVFNNQDNPTTYSSLDFASNNNSNSNEDLENKEVTGLKALQCGFGGGSCVTKPINSALFAPGSSDSILGYPTSELSVDTGKPVYSSATGIMTSFGCKKTTYPTSALSVGCTSNSAGGILGTWSPKNNHRVFIGITITGAYGNIICKGGPANVVGYKPGVGKAPLERGGNCTISYSENANICENNGSNGNVSSLGYLDKARDNKVGLINASKTKTGIVENATGIIKLTSNELDLIFKVIRQEDLTTEEISKALEIFSKYHKQGDKELFKITGGAIGGDYLLNSKENGILNNSEGKKVVEIKMDRVYAFPNYIMRWVTRQSEEIFSKLAVQPTLHIILPEKKDLNIWDTKDSKIYGGLKLDDTGFKELESASLKTTYEFLGSLPIVNINTTTINVKVPYESQINYDKFIGGKEGLISEWQSNIVQWEDILNRAKIEWPKYCAKLSDSIDAKDESKVNSNDIKRLEKCNESVDSLDNIEQEIKAYTKSVKDNIKIINSYKNIPEQLVKIYDKKNEYTLDILGYVRDLEKIHLNWIKENGSRYKLWITHINQVKTILKSWQPFLDLFTDYEVECGKCKNDRWDLKHWQFKQATINSVLPDIPVIRFIKNSDILIDLHNIDLGINLSIPNINLDYVQFELPNLKELVFPETPVVEHGPSIEAFTSLDILPMDRLPEFEIIDKFPDIIPKVGLELPDLPAPVKIHKMLPEIASYFEILKGLKIRLCELAIDIIAPEWRVGDQLANLTQRNSTSWFDYIDKAFPEFTVAGTRVPTEDFDFTGGDKDLIRIDARSNIEFNTNFSADYIRDSAVSNINNFTKGIIKDYSDTSSNPSNPSSESTVLNIFNTKINKFFNKNNIKLNNNSNIALLKIITKSVNSLEKDKNKLLNTEQVNKVFIKGIKNLSSDDSTKAKEIRSNLLSSVNYDYAQENKDINNLKNINHKKYSITQDYLKNVILENKKIISNLRNKNKTNILNPVLIKSLENNYKNNLNSKNIKTNLERFQKGLITNVLNKNNKNINTKLLDSAYINASNKLKNVIESGSSLAQISTTSVERFSGANAVSLYKNKYSGLYLVDENNKQRHLINIDDISITDSKFGFLDKNNSNNGIISNLENKIFIKYTNKNTNNYSHISGIKKGNISKELDSIGASGSVDNLVSYPKNKEVTFKFTPSDNTIDKYELKYTNGKENYIAHLSRDNELNTLINNPKYNTNIITKNPENAKYVISRNNAILYSATGNVDMYYPEFNKFKKNDIFSLANYDTIYAITPVKFEYISLEDLEFNKANDPDISHIPDIEYTTITLAKGTNFYSKELGILNIKIKYGEAIKPEDIIRKYENVNLADFKGFPIFDNTRILLNKYSNNNKFSVKFGDGRIKEVKDIYSYRYINIGFAEKEYLVNFKEDNGSYTSYITPIGINNDGLMSESFLIHSQTAADLEPPIINSGSGGSESGLGNLLQGIKLPAYQSRTIEFKDLFTDTSGISNIELKAKSGVILPGFIQKVTPTSFRFYDFDDIGQFPLILKVSDSNYNINTININLIVYAPKPDITDINKNIISGILSEKLEGEPITIFRYRDKNLEKFNLKGSFNKENIYSNNNLTDIDGDFSLIYIKGLNILDKDNNIIFRINKDTGVLELLDNLNYKYKDKRLNGLGEDIIFLNKENNKEYIIFNYKDYVLNKLDSDIIKKDLSDNNIIWNEKAILGAEIKDTAGNIVLKINENTGLLELVDKINYKLELVKASLANENHMFTKLVFLRKIYDNNGNFIRIEEEDIYKFYNISQSNYNIYKYIDDNNLLDSKGIFIKDLDDNLTFVKAQYNDPSIPSGGYIVNSEQNSLLAINKNGDIYLQDNTLSLELSKYKDYIAYNIIKNGDIILQIIINFDGFTFGSDKYND